MHHVVRLRALLSAAVFCLSGSPALSGGEPDAPTEPSWSLRSVSFDSGPRAAVGRDAGAAEVVFSREMVAPGAAWVRLNFDVADLPGRIEGGRGAWMFITASDGAVQALNAEHMAQWGFTSAYFNGDRVRIDLVAYPGEGSARVAVSRVVAGESAAGERTICGTSDDRVLSSDPRVARLMPLTCTGWLIADANRTMLSAGHCNVVAGTVAQFNVPLSLADGTPVFPAPQHQYVVDPTSVQFQSAGLGSDWAYFGCFPNSNTGLTAFQAQGQAFTLASAAAPQANATIRMTGNGLVSSPTPLTWNAVQKTGTGPYISLSGSAISHGCDSTGGNSGGPIILESTGAAIGIHTSGSCNSSGGANFGTATQCAGLQAALASPRGVCGSGATGAPGGPLFAIGDAANNFGTVRRDTGVFSRLSAPMAGPIGLAYRTADDRFYALDQWGRLTALAPSTGMATPGPTISGASAAVTAVTYDARLDRFFGVANATGQIYRIDPTLGTASAVGGAFGGNINAVAIVTYTNQLLGIDNAPGGTRLVVFNRLTGEQIVVGNLGLGLAQCAGLSWSDDAGVLTTIDTVGRRVISINPHTGAATAMGSTAAVWNTRLGLAYRRTEAICVADLNADGVVNVKDLTRLLGSLGQPTLPGATGDVSGDGQVNLADLTIMFSVYGCVGTVPTPSPAP